MPTGYTAELYDGKDISFNDFVLNCARAMGAAIMQRDDGPGPIAGEYEVGTYYLDSLTKAQERLAELEGWKAEDWKAAERKEREAQTNSVNEAIQKAADRRSRYESMLVQVQGWRPPTSEHEGLKNFMVEQLEQSIKFDCSTTYLTVPPMRPWEEFKVAELLRAQKAVDRAAESWQEEQDRTAGRNKWVADLRSSLVKPVAV